METFQTGRFAKSYKKLHTKEKESLVLELAKIIKDPYIGKQKTGVLRRVYVHKFKYGKELKLIGYIPGKDKITFLAYGGHENFYKQI